MPYATLSIVFLFFICSFLLFCLYFLPFLFILKPLFLRGFVMRRVLISDELARHITVSLASALEFSEFQCEREMRLEGTDFWLNVSVIDAQMVGDFANALMAAEVVE